MAGIDFDLDCFPLVRITNHEGTTDADYKALCERLSALVQKGERFVCVASATGVAFPSASQRKIVADWMPSVKAPMNRLSLGCAVVMKSPLQRGAITALSWIMRPEMPIAAFETTPEALGWCRARLVEANVPMPAKVDRLLRGAA